MGHPKSPTDHTVSCFHVTQRGQGHLLTRGAGSRGRAGAAGNGGGESYRDGDSQDPDGEQVDTPAGSDKASREMCLKRVPLEPLGLLVWTRAGQATSPAPSHLGPSSKRGNTVVSVPRTQGKATCATAGEGSHLGVVAAAVPFPPYVRGRLGGAGARPAVIPVQAIVWAPVDRVKSLTAISQSHHNPKPEAHKFQRLFF